MFIAWYLENYALGLYVKHEKKIDEGGPEWSSSSSSHCSLTPATALLPMSLYHGVHNNQLSFINKNSFSSIAYRPVQGRHLVLKVFCIPGI